MQEEVGEKIAEVVKEDIWGSIVDFLNLGFHFGEGESKIHITVGILLLLIFSFLISSLFLKWIRRFFTRKMDEADKNKFNSFFKFIKYLTNIIVVFAVLSMAGVNITPFLAASAALLVGLGLALQELFQDVIGGIFIILDKSLLVGDIVELEGKVGRILEIKLRTTRAITRDDKIIIIPNHKFIRNTIYNHTQNHKTTRSSIKIGVAYGSDTELVKNTLLESATSQSSILKKPKPFVAFEDFGDSALVFSIYFFISDSFKEPGIQSDLRFTIDQKFREQNIAIPFPQRDVHLIPISENS